jgi:hypothetical protein
MLMQSRTIRTQVHKALAHSMQLHTAAIMPQTNAWKISLKESIYIDYNFMIEFSVTIS